MEIRENIIGGQRCLHWQSFDIMEEIIPPDSGDYAYGEPDIECLNKQIELSDVPLKREFPPEMKENIDRAKHILVEYLKREGVVSQAIPVEEVEYNGDGSCGYGYKENFHNKRDFVEKGGLETIYREFWESAHKCGWTGPYIMKCKTMELLKKKKLREKNVRVFKFPQVTEYFYSAQIHQKFNKRMLKLGGLSALGSAFQRGGFDRLIKEIIKGMEHFFKGDCTKYDKYFEEALSRVCQQIREECWKFNPNYPMTFEEWKERSDWTYDQSIHAFLLSEATGQIIQTLAGMQKSGTIFTTTDNTLGHMVIMIYTVISLHPELDTMDKILRHLHAKIYADDHLGGVSKKLEFFLNYEVRRDFYKQFSMQLKKEDDKVSDTIEGMVLLGAEVVKWGTYYVPRYDLNKIKTSLSNVHRQYDAATAYNRAYSLYLLAVFNDDEKFLKKMRKYLAHLLKNGVNDTLVEQNQDLLNFITTQGLQLIPTIDEARNFWLGLESNESAAGLTPSCAQGQNLRHADLNVIPTFLSQIISELSENSATAISA